jgi:hypothetical protein
MQRNDSVINAERYANVPRRLWCAIEVKLVLPWSVRVSDVEVEAVEY